ncbi:hypothetical protein PMG11_11242 [Penicillium brasilianum]|uniref:Uncharacterized protein n=1 Tax=Penicillium brasilianum TaxID=104259 RepID=A0A0F7U3B7_PENBI|nr:hypothetical protein PMG11_11242 [Penicillium brasilianum]
MAKARKDLRWLDLRPSVGLCDAIQSNLGLDPDMLRKASAMCDCIPRVLELVKNGAFSRVAADSDVSTLTSGLLGIYSQLQKCFLDNAFAIQDDRNKLLTTGDLSTPKGTIVVRAAEFAGSIATCVTGACDVNGIKEFFLDYLRQSQQSIADQLKSIFQPWTTNITGMHQQLESLGSSLDAVSHTSQEIQSQIKILGVPSCKNPDVCAKDALKTFNENVSKNLQLQLAIDKDKDAIPRVFSVISRMVDLIKGVEDAASTTPNIEGLVKLITDQRIKKLSDIVEILQVTKDLPNLVKDLHDQLPTVGQFVLALNQMAQASSDSIASILSDSWKQQADVMSDETRQNIISIQSKFRDQISPTIADIKTKISAIQDFVSALPFNGGAPSSKVKVASYGRWSPVAMNMPCSRWATQQYEASGFKGSFGYPQFYNCLYQETIEWPNHHIPYIKVQFV